MAGVALDDMDRHFAWQAWHLQAWHLLCDIHLHFVWQASHLMTWIVTLRGRRGTCQHMDRHFAWQAWHLQAWHLSTHGSSLCVAGVLRCRRGTYGTGLALVAHLVPRPRWDAAAFCVAGVALCDIHLHFVW